MEQQFKPTPLEDIFKEQATNKRPVWYGAPGEPMPLEEILAGAERVTVPELAPTPAENSDPNINPIGNNDSLPWHLQPTLNPRSNDTFYSFPTQPFQADSPPLAQDDGGIAAANNDDAWFKEMFADSPGGGDRRLEGVSGQSPSPLEGSDDQAYGFNDSTSIGFPNRWGGVRNPGPADGQDREPGTYLTGHRVLGVGPTHTAIEYVDETGKAHWISAGSSLEFNARLVSGLDSELSAAEIQQGDDYNRPSDHPENNVTLGRITPPGGMDDAAHFDMLGSMDDRYADDINYNLFPKIQGSHNSNSYTRGLLDASGGSYTVPFDDYVGGETPVPETAFTSPHLRGHPNSLLPQPVPYFRRRR
jgi:hypothetical protein